MEAPESIVATAPPRIPAALNARTLAAVSTTIVLWGAAFAAIRLCLHSGAFSPGHLALLRFGVASIVLGAASPVLGVRVPRRHDLPAIIAMGLSGVTIYQIALNYGAVGVTAGGTGFLISTAPIFTAILAIVLLGERPTSWGWVGILVSFSGVFVIAVGEGQGTHFQWRAMLIVFSAFCASVYAIIQKRLLVRYTAMEVTTYAMWSGTLPFFYFARGSIDAFKVAPTAAQFSLVALGVFSTALAYVTWSYALSHLKASQTMSFLYLMPGVTVLVAWLWLGEIPHRSSLLGGALALTGVVIVNCLGHRIPTPLRED